MCIVAACPNENFYATANWKMGGLCPIHFAKFINDFGYTSGVGLDLCRDYVKIYVLLQHNVTRCLEHMRELEREITAARSRFTGSDTRDIRFIHSDENYVKLSRVLEYYEGYCWFPANRPLLAGLLSSAAFEEASELGLNKDYGAGLKHGEQTHRIQWHAILREATAGFQLPFDAASGWAHTPLRLYYEMNNGPSKTNKTWAKLMDSVNNIGWGHPDRLMVSLRQSGLRFITGALNRRTAKYGGVEINDYVNKPKSDPSAWKLVRSPRGQAIWDEATKLIEGVPPNPDVQALENTGYQRSRLKMDIDGVIYSWEKMGPPSQKPQRRTLEYVSLLVFERARKKYPHLFPKKVHFNYSLNEVGTPLHKHAPDTGVKIDSSRSLQSANGFNMQYQYNKVTGAKPGFAQDDRW